MIQTRRIMIMLTCSLSLCFFLGSLATSEADDLNHKRDNIPLWGITYDGTDESLEWEDHEPNPRFAIYDPETPEKKTDDIVLDKETGLVWARDANYANGEKAWQHAVLFCRNVALGNRKGWRLPSVVEFSSLVDPSTPMPSLPEGHPFVKVQSTTYWTSTLYETISAYAWSVNLSNGNVRNTPYKSYNFVWPVRGGDE